MASACAYLCGDVCCTKAFVRQVCSNWDGNLCSFINLASCYTRQIVICWLRALDGGCDADVMLLTDGIHDDLVPV
jgi:hypothetical protein